MESVRNGISNELNLQGLEFCKEWNLQVKVKVTLNVQIVKCSSY